jgi:hypothetical protein
MRELLVAIVVIAAAEAVDIALFDGHYGRVIWRQGSDGVRLVQDQVSSATGWIPMPDLSRKWKIP